MVTGQQMKEDGQDQNYEWFLYLTFRSFASYKGYVNNVLWTSSIKYKFTLKGGTFISDAVLQCSVYLYYTALINKASI